MHIGLAFHTAVMMDDMLLVYGGVRAMKYDASDELWAFCFGTSDSVWQIPLTGAWSKLAMSGEFLPGRLYGHGMALREGEPQQLWIVGGATCLATMDADGNLDDSTCAEDSATQVIANMNSMFILNLAKDGLEYERDENGTMSANVQRVTMLSGDGYPIPEPRILSAMAIVADFILMFGGASAKAMASSDQGWGDLNDFWGIRIGVESDYLWRSLEIAGQQKPKARASSSMILDEPYIYIFAGANIESGELADMWRYNIQGAVPERSTVFGENLRIAVANEDSSIEIDARTLFNTKIPECTSDFEVQFQSLQTAAFISGDVMKTQVSSYCRFVVNFKIRSIGLFKMTVKTGGQPILGSPSEINILPGRTNDGQSTAVGIYSHKSSI
jgi:hypothetical protein